MARRQATPLLALVLFSLTSHCPTQAESWYPPERCRGGTLWQDYLARHPYAATTPAHPHTWDAPVNHFDTNDASTFKQRYFLDAQYFQPSSANSSTGLVFLMIGGEGTLLGPPGGFVKE